LFGSFGTASADDAPEDWSLHGQVTVVDQYHPAFRSPIGALIASTPAVVVMKHSMPLYSRAFAFGMEVKHTSIRKSIRVLD
jgi:uncharacterized NAD-dependent epimerase/dehydratase family protein